MNEIKLPIRYDLDVKNFSKILNKKEMVTSYKAYFFKAIFNNICKSKKKILLSDLAIDMIVGAWYTVSVYKLSLGMQDRISEVINDILEINPELIKENNIDKIRKYIVELCNANEEIKNKILDRTNYVVYRLIRPMLDIEPGLTDHKINISIEKHSNNNPNSLYKINTDAGYIEINDDWFEYIYNNQSIIDAWIEYKLVNYLQSRNKSVPAIIYKTKLVERENLVKQTNVYKELLKKESIRDLYNKETFTEENFIKYGGLSLDHFIPFTFVLHNEIWNLVPVFKNINSAKNNKLPNLELYLEEFCEYQWMLFSFLLENSKNVKYKNLLLEYVSINSKMTCENMFEYSKAQFIEDLENTIIPLYQIASNQGFENW